MDPEGGKHQLTRPAVAHSLFRLFTKESLTKIHQSAEKEKDKAQAKKDHHHDHEDEKEEEGEKQKPNPALEAGKKVPTRMGEFPAQLYGKPIEDLDEYYNTKYTFLVVGKDRTMFRFSAKNANFFASPFNPVRRTAVYIICHPFFGLFVMLVILVNCIFMAIQTEIKYAEEIFTAIYTCEGLVKVLARGFIFCPFTYLRDMWNWLDFTVVSFAYITMLPNLELGNLTALRTCRVLRALKTVAVVPGLKTIVGALLEAVRRLRDVMILSVFILAIFALVGLQIYQGTLRVKCVFDGSGNFTNETFEEKMEFYNQKENWLLEADSNQYKLCGNSSGYEQCPENYTCRSIGDNPNHGYTSFDNFGWAMLCAFRLMTQDYWENLYQLIIRANGPWHMLFFVVVILLGSFYLVNLILAIVAMSYDEQQKQDQEDEEAEEEAIQEAHKMAMEQEALLHGGGPKSPSMSSIEHSDMIPVQSLAIEDKERISMKSECGMDRTLSIVTNRGKKQPSLSLPGSPYTYRRDSRRDSKFSWGKKRPSPRGDRMPLVLPYLHNLDLPYADDSNAVTPTSEDLCNLQHTQQGALVFAGHRRRLSSTSYSSKMSQLESRFMPGSRRSSFASQRSRGPGEYQLTPRDRGNSNREPTHFQWNVSFRKKQPQAHTLFPEIVVDKTKSDDNESSSSGSESETAKGKLFPDNPFICRTPSATMVDMNDVLVLKDLINHASGNRRSKCNELFHGFLHPEGMTRKEYVKEKCLQLIFDYECSPCWRKFAHYVDLFIMDAFVDLFITLCIVVNTLFMALDQHDMDESLANTLILGNYVFTTIFTVEALLKVIALNPINYLKDKWNCFDIIIVFLSLVELGLANVKGLSILRSFRLLRVFKLAKSWPTLNLLIGIIGRTMGALGNLCFVLAIIIFIFAVMGMQLFGQNYNLTYFPEGIPRWNFTDFLHSFMIVFRVLCGEWIESMWNCMYCTGYVCIPFFLLTMVIGNLVVLNLFLALLLSSFGAESLQQSQEDSEPNKLQEAIDRINRFVLFIKSHVLYCVKVKIRHKGGGLMVVDPDPSMTKTDLSSKDCLALADGDIPMRNGRLFEQDASDDDSPHDNKDLRTFTLRLVKGTSMSHVGYSPVSPYEPSEDGEGKACGQGSTRPASKASSSTAKVSKSTSRESKLARSPSCSSRHSCRHHDDDDDDTSSSMSGSNFSYSKDETISLEKPIDQMDGPEINEVNVVFVKYPDECCPKCCLRQFPCCDMLDKTTIGQKWWTARCYMYKVVEHKYFETFIIGMILGSSLALAIEDVYLHQRPTLHTILKVLDKVFTVIFVLEMLLKWAAYGFKKYFQDAWCWLDFVIVTISLISLGAESAGLNNISAFRALRTLRALRPLRAVSRWEGMKVVVNALIQAIPSILNVLLVCLVFWLIFSIMGVQLFAGRFHKCVDEWGVTMNASIIPNVTACSDANLTWQNSDINFDNILIGYLALLQVATFKGWMDIMHDAVSSHVEKGLQPIPEVRVLMYLYFVLFIIFGSFFTLNLFIGVIIDNFNMQKKKGGSLEMFMTEDQKKYYNAMKKLGSKQPQKPIPKPRFKCQLFFFKLTTNQKFDIGIMSVILFNMVTMALEHYNQSQEFQKGLTYFNIVFIAVFTLECVMKILGLRWYYFKQPWNVFDFVVVVLSILGLAMSDIIEDYFVSPTLLRVVRVFRVGRVLRLVKSAKGIRTLLFSLAVSMPALFNIGLLLFLVMFIYAMFGMSFFMHVKHTAGLTEMFNFETFGRSMILLFQISTSAGWDGVLTGLMNDEAPVDCNATSTAEKPSGDCGNRHIAVLFLITYLVISFLVIINMYIAVILENFSQATEDVQQGLTQDDFDMYYEIWEKFDEQATQYIPLTSLTDFVDTLEEPLRIPLPNYFKLVSMDITICEDDKVHCVDILDVLTKNFLGTSTDATGDLGEVKKGPERANYVPISSTMMRHREIVCARIIQRCWRDYVARRKEAGGGGMAASDEKRDKKPEQSIITIEETGREDEEDDKESQLQETGDSGMEKGQKDEEGKEKKNEDKKEEEEAENNTDTSTLGADDSRTVELYPESGVVA